MKEKKKIYNIPGRTWRKRDMLRKTTRRARRDCQASEEAIPSSGNRVSHGFLPSSSVGAWMVLVLLGLFLLAKSPFFFDKESELDYFGAKESIFVDFYAHKYDNTGLPSFSNTHNWSWRFNWLMWCINLSVTWCSALLYSVCAILSFYHVLESGAQGKVKYILPKTNSKSSKKTWRNIIKVTRSNGSSVRLTRLGLRLFMMYHGSRYMLSIVSQYQVGLMYWFIFFAVIPLVDSLDTMLLHCVSKAMGLLRSKSLGAADLPGSILHCILSLLLAQYLLVLSSSLLKLIVDDWISSIIWQGLALEDIVEVARDNAAISAGAFAVILAKNIFAARLSCNCSTTDCIMQQLKAMGSTTQLVTKSYVTTSIVGLFFQAAVSNIIQMILPGQTLPCVSNYMNMIIQIPVNILSGTMGYLILCGFCSLLVGALIFIINKAATVSATIASKLEEAPPKSQEEKGNAFLKAAQAEVQVEKVDHFLDDELCHVCNEERHQHPQASERLLVPVPDEVVNEDVTAAQPEVKVEEVDPDEDDELCNFRNDWRRHQHPQEGEGFMVPVPDQEIAHGDGTVSPTGSQSFGDETLLMQKVKRGGMRCKTRHSSSLRPKHFYSTCILFIGFGLASASGDSAGLDQSFDAIAATAVAATAAAGVMAGAALIGRANTDDAEGPISIITVPAGSLGIVPIFRKNPRGALLCEIDTINKKKCPFKDQVEVGDLIVSVDGKAVSCRKDLIRGNDKERKLGVIKASKAVILDGVVLLPPEQNGTYTDDQVMLLGKLFDRATIHKAFDKAGCRPKRSTIYKLPKDLHGKPLSHQEQEDYEDMIFHWDKCMDSPSPNLAGRSSTGQHSARPEHNEHSRPEHNGHSRTEQGQISATVPQALSDSAASHNSASESQNKSSTSERSGGQNSSVQCQSLESQSSTDQNQNLRASVSQSGTLRVEDNSSESFESRSSTAAVITPTNAVSSEEEEAGSGFFDNNSPNVVPACSDDDEHVDTVNLERMASNLLEKLVTADDSFVPGINLQSIADMVLGKLSVIQESTKHGPIELSYRGEGGKACKHRYMKLPNKVACKASSSNESKQHYVRRKAAAMKQYFGEIVEQSTENGKEMAEAVIIKMAKDYELVAFKRSYFRLTPEEVALIRDFVGTTTNGMYRLKSTLEAIRPELRGLLLPPCIKALLARVDGSDNFENKTVDVECIITKAKDANVTGVRPFAFIVRPWEVIARIVEKTKVEGSYKPSQTWMKAEDKCVITMNADKGNDINLSIRCANKEGGNSMNDTYCIASIEGPVCECIETEMETIFNKEYPIQSFLQGLLNQSYYVFTIMTPKGRCQSVVFQPTPTSDKVCVSRPIGVTLVNDLSTIQSNVVFSETVSERGGPPEVSIPASAEGIVAKLVLKDDDKNAAVGVQFMVGTESKFTHAFRTPLSLDGVDFESIKVSVEQIIGFPPNDGKQQLICIGIPSNSCRYACPSCICHRDDFGNWSERLWNAALRLGLKSGPWPYENVTKREGKWSFQKCLDNYHKATHNGYIQPTGGEDERISKDCASISKTIGLSVWPEINCGDCMHLSSGLINHTMNKIRKRLRAFEANSVFMQEMLRSKTVVEQILQELEISKSKKKNDNDLPLESILAPLHKESVAIRRKMSNALAKVQKLKLELALHYQEEDEIGEDEQDDIASYRKTSKELEEEIEMYRNRADELWEDCKNHSDESGYGHFIQLQRGMLTFYNGMVQFLSGSSKKPHGKLEFVFNNALEHVGGGRFSAENSGFDQTNGRGMNTLEKFGDVADVCVLAYRSDPRYGEVKQMFDDYRELASALYELTKYMKSQEKRNADELVDLLVKFLAKYEALFPGEKCYNKLHFVMWHLVDFVEQWGTCGRLSAESHESVHTAFEKAKSVVCKMSSTSKRFNTLFARMTLDLKSNIAQIKKAVTAKMTGKARGRYNTNHGTKRDDDVDVVSSSFSRTKTFDGEEFLILPCDGGLIHEEYRNQFVYVATGRAPDDWTKCFAESKLLSEAKQEEAKYATYHRVH